MDLQNQVMLYFSLVALHCFAGFMDIFVALPITWPNSLGSELFDLEKSW